LVTVRRDACLPAAAETDSGGSGLSSDEDECEGGGSGSEGGSGSGSSDGEMCAEQGGWRGRGRRGRRCWATVCHRGALWQPVPGGAAGDAARCILKGLLACLDATGTDCPSRPSPFPPLASHPSTHHRRRHYQQAPRTLTLSWRRSLAARTWRARGARGATRAGGQRASARGWRRPLSRAAARRARRGGSRRRRRRAAEVAAGGAASPRWVTGRAWPGLAWPGLAWPAPPLGCICQAPASL
jgi:hypothetical protein